MAEDRRKHVGLFTKFTTLLESLGINVSRADDDSEDALEQAAELQGYVGDGEELPGWTRTHGRRASSFDPALSRISEADTKQSAEAEDILSRPPNPSSGHQRRPSDTVADVLATNYTRCNIAPRDGLSRERLGRRNSSEHLPIRRKRDRSTSSHGSLRIRRLSSTSRVPFPEPTQDSTVASNPDPNIDDVGAMMWTRPSETELQEYADAFEHHHEMKLSRQTLQHWSDVAQNLRRRNADMAVVAEAHDRGILLKSGFETLRSAYEHRKATKETERFFAHLEGRASKARDLYLLTKAFTHWAQLASEEVLRTSVARRHILRTRYFNAWRDITAVNEMKVRRFTLKKFIGKWRERTIQAIDGHITAISLRESNLVAKIYWQWFWQFCERRAPIWGHRRVKTSVFQKWREYTMQLRDREDWVIGMRLHDTQRRALRAWHSRLQSNQSQIMTAEVHYNHNLKTQTLFVLSKVSQLRPIADQFSKISNRNLQRHTFSVWLDRTRFSRQATKWRRDYALRTALTKWNDNLRYRSLSTRIDDRLVVEALYKWILASRAALLCRVHNTAVKRSLFATWRTRAHQVRIELATDVCTFQTQEHNKLLRNCFQKWQSSCRDIRQSESTALNHHEQVIITRTFQGWMKAYDGIRQLGQWSADANYYVITKHVLAKWRNSTKESQRQRKRHLYVQFRTQKKKNLAQQVLNVWRNATGRVALMEREAIDIRENRLVRGTDRVLRSWHAQTQRLVEMQREADHYRHQQLLTMSYGRWTQRQQLIRNLKAVAAPLEAAVSGVYTSNCFKKLNWRLFKIQRQSQNAVALEQRNFAKHVRNMLRFWSERSLEQRDAKLRDAFDTSPSPLKETDESAFGLANFDPNLSLFPPGDEDASMVTSTPLPGYLRTPSKRSFARRKVFSLSTHTPGNIKSTTRAPATAPAETHVRDIQSVPEGVGRITPFGQKLVAQGFSERRSRGMTSASPTPSSFRRPREDRSRVEFHGFDDIKEESMEDVVPSHVA